MTTDRAPSRVVTVAAWAVIAATTGAVTASLAWAAALATQGRLWAAMGAWALFATLTATAWAGTEAARPRPTKENP